jgi:hypothetical protein
MQNELLKDCLKATNFLTIAKSNTEIFEKDIEELKEKNENNENSSNLNFNKETMKSMIYFEQVIILLQDINKRENHINLHNNANYFVKKVL